MRAGALLRRGTATGLAVALVCCGAACSGASSPSTSPRPGSAEPTGRAEELRAELLQMARDDQTERTGQGLPDGAKLPPIQDYTRTVRLKEIIAEHGWPTHALVGEDGASAAWLVAQHADFDVDFQEVALGLMDDASAEDEVDATEVAYLADRVAVNRDRPQLYGTQVRCRDGRPRPATPIEDRTSVDARRLDVGMDPLGDYFGELAMMCADEAAEGQTTGP